LTVIALRGIAESDSEDSLGGKAGKAIKLNKLAAITAIALAAGLGLAACGSSSAPTSAPAGHAAAQATGLPAGAWYPGSKWPNVACGSPTSGTNGLNTTYVDQSNNGVFTIDMDDPQESPCNGSDPNSDVTAPAPAPAKHLTHITQDGAGNTTWYHNYWSNGSVTICTVTSGVFSDGAQDATGDCAPDGVPSGISGGSAQPN
jgi:hypothetical protein